MKNEKFDRIRRLENCEWNHFQLNWMKVKLLKLKLVVFSVQCYTLMWKPNLYLKWNISQREIFGSPHYKDELPMHLNLSKRSRLKMRLNNFNQTRFAPFQHLFLNFHQNTLQFSYLQNTCMCPVAILPYSTLLRWDATVGPPCVFLILFVHCWRFHCFSANWNVMEL